MKQDAAGIRLESLNWKLDQHTTLRSMSSEEFDPLFQRYTQEFFDDATQVFRLREALSPEEREKMKFLREQMNLANPLQLQLGLFVDGEFAGWHFGRQDSVSSFYMQNSGVLPKFRRRGLYTEMLKRVLETTTQLGFLDVWSRHNATNNDVIIPKLKLGFVISALEVSDVFGTLVHLRYYPSALRRKMTDYRVGQIKPDAEIKRLLKID